MSTTRSLYRAFARLDAFPSLRFTLICGGLLFVVFSVLAGLHIGWMFDDLMSPLEDFIRYGGLLALALVMLQPLLVGMLGQIIIASRILPSESYQMVKTTPVSEGSLTYALWLTTLHRFRVPLVFSFALVPFLVALIVPASFRTPASSPLYTLEDLNLFDAVLPSICWWVVFIGQWGISLHFARWGVANALRRGTSRTLNSLGMLASYGMLVFITLAVLAVFGPVISRPPSQLPGRGLIILGGITAFWGFWPFLWMWIVTSNWLRTPPE